VTTSNVNPNDPSVVGQWTAPVAMPIVAVHQVSIANTGKILMWTGQTTNGTTYVFDPVNNGFTSVPNTFNNLFCSGQVIMADGRILASGGDVQTTPGATGLGIKNADIFNPATNSWSQAANMTYKRWYPGSMTMADGRVFVLSGSDESYRSYVPQPEIYNPQTNTWSTLPASANYAAPMYPFPLSIS
jgi:galactose oxidase